MQTTAKPRLSPRSAKYEIFQWIKFSKNSETIDGIITGLEYVTPAVASIEGSDDHGYMYIIRRELDDGLQSWWVPENNIIERE